MAKKSKKSGPKVDPYLDSVVAKLVDRLSGIERKLDSLISRTSSNSNKPAPNGQPQSAPVQQQPPARKERTLYEAICADCGKVCEVPFRPVEGRSVYCKECFGRRKSGGNSHGMPVLTPAVASPKPESKLGLPPAVPAASKKAKKSAPAKKAKKGKK